MSVESLGHKTRYSDSSLFDEICIYCGATDARGDDGLKKLCPIGSDIDKVNIWRVNHDEHGRWLWFKEPTK